MENQDIEKEKINSKETTIRFSPSSISIKEENGEFYSEGFIATTHPDRAGDEHCVGEILTKQALQQMAILINDGVASNDMLGNPRAVSDRHDWIKENDPNKPVAGMAVPPAEVKQRREGH